MSKIIATAAIKGAYKVVERAEKRWNEAMETYGPQEAVEFPNTGYYLPIIYAMTGLAVKTVGDMEEVLRRCKELLPPIPSQDLWLPYLGHALDAGMATLWAGEVIEALKYLMWPNPVDGIWLGAADDIIMRERGIEFVDGTAPGFAAVLGAAPTNEIAVKIARELQQKNLYVFISSNTNGISFAEQLDAENVQLGWPTRLVPFGKDTSATVYSLGFASRAAMSFGGVKPGDYRRNLLYNKNRVFAFAMPLGYVDEEKYAYAAGAINYGFPVIADTPIPQILPTGVCTYEHVVSDVPHDKIVSKAIEVRGLKVQITEIPIPVAYGPAFEGERIRKDEIQVEFGGNRSVAFELLRMRDMSEVEDGKVTVVGPEIDQVKEGNPLPLGIVVEVAGRKMQEDFEPVLERQIHYQINGAEGVWHMGQRDIIWSRISKSTFKRGFKIRHLGDIIHAKLLSDYPAIVDKVQVTLYTDESRVKELIEEARSIYRQREKKIAQMTDESVDIFYSCLLCQSFAPNHVCVISPERSGLCGAVNWLDGKAAYEINPTGPNQPVPKGEVVDKEKGVFFGVNQYIQSKSGGNVDLATMYSMIESPMTSCGCFECILALLPSCNGIMVVNREFAGMTPSGMKFSTLAGIVGGGQVTPGFCGVGKVYLTSKKFISGDGGFFRICWMPKELKETLREDLKRRASELGDPGFVDKIADEEVATTEEEVLAYMEQVQHPALSMDPMF